MKAWIPIVCVVVLAAVILGTSSSSSDEEQCSAKRKQEEANKKLVTTFYQGMLGDKDIAAIDKYVDPNYIQHSPEVADGIEGIKESFRNRNAGKGAQWFLEKQIDFQHVGAEGDLVFLHVRTHRDGKLNSVMDIFKVKDGKVVEHWDVFRALPDIVKNDHPLF